MSLSNPYKPEEMIEALYLLQMRMCNNALQHNRMVDIRTYQILKGLGLINKEGDIIGDDLDFTAILDPSHPFRINMSKGPLVVYRDMNDSTKLKVVDLTILLLSDKVETRKVAIESFMKMIQSNDIDITPITGSKFSAFKERIIVDDPSVWRSASVSLFDAFCNDIVISLQGARQCLESEPVIQESLNIYVKKLLYPSIASLETISLVITNPESEHTKIKEVIRQILESSVSLSDACSAYYNILGFLPISPNYGMPTIVQEWIDDHKDVIVWDEIWKWAKATPGPIPRYHACIVFILCPDLIPSGKLPDLWNEIINIINVSIKQEDNDDIGIAWKLRRDLVRHFSFHLETLLPDSNSAHICCFAWWLSEQVAGLFTENPESLKFYYTNWIQKSLELSNSVWITTRPRIQSSFLRYITFTITSPWVLSLISIISDKIDLLKLPEQSDEIKDTLNNSLLWNSIFTIPFQGSLNDDPTYSLENSLMNVLPKYLGYIPQEHQVAINQLISQSKEINTNEGLCKALSDIDKLTITEQYCIALAFKSKVYLDPQIYEAIWGVISNEKWRSEVLGKIDTTILWLLFESISILQVHARGDWFYILPHYIADMCEIVEEDNRRQELFIYVLLSSLAADSYSAIKKILRGANKEKYKDILISCVQYFDTMRPTYPPWVTGRLRALIANLRIV